MKKLISLLLILALLPFAALADTKISAMSAGTPAQSGDKFPIARSGANYYLTVGDAAAYAVGSSSGASSVVFTGGTMNGVTIGGSSPAAGTFTTITSSDNAPSANNGTPASVAGMTVTEKGMPYRHVTTFTFTNVAISTTHNGGTDGFGALAIYTFPSKVMGRNGSRFNLTSVSSSGGVNSASTFLLAAGTTQQTAAGTAIVSNGDTYFPTGLTVTLSGGTASNVAGAGNGVASLLDGTSTTRTLYLNIAGVDDSANGTITISGTLTIVWDSFS